MDEDIDKLLPYSLGQLDKKEQAEFENSLAQDPGLDKELRELQLVLEAVALSDKPIKLDVKLKGSLLTSLNAETPFNGYINRFMKLFDLERNEVASLFDKIVNAPHELFKSCGIPKTALFYFDGGPQVAHATCGILKIKAGAIFPAHQHQGKEWVLVLQGSAIDQSGIRYLPGDIIYSDEKVYHALRVGKEQDLIFAVVLEKPNKWLLGQIVLDYVFPGRRFKSR